MLSSNLSCELFISVFSISLPSTTYVFLSEINVVLLFQDEIHEREQNTDYLLIALKQALKKRNDLKVCLVSMAMFSKEVFLSN